MNDELEMVERFFGFGRWGAPYWFIGPEPGGEGNDVRASAWISRFKKADLVDCKEFHDALVREMSDRGFDSKSIRKVKRWYPEPPESSKLQPTWRRLILLLMAYLDKPQERSDPSTYQRDSWGRVDAKKGETCVIELLGLPAKGLIGEIEEHGLKLKRTTCIRKMILANKPELAVMYGRSEENYWKLIAGPDLPRDKVMMLGTTKIIFLPHPNDFGRMDEEWITWGEKLRNSG